MANNTYNKRLTGVVSNTKIKKDYSGGKTETAAVHVDTNTKEITVDVITEALLDGSHEDPNKAYPANLGAAALRRADTALMWLEDEHNRAVEAEDNLSSFIKQTDKKVSVVEGKLLTKIEEVASQTNTLEETYAPKEFVMEQIALGLTLSKQVVDSIDVENNTVTVNGVVKTPVDGYIYLLKDSSIVDDDVYKQYTVVNKQLILIGSTGMSLEGYATEEFVEQRLEGIDLSEYAKLSDIPDVSDFITQIPSEYITEAELDEKNYLNVDIAAQDYASKIYVQTELAKIGSLSKQIVDSVDLDNNKIIIADEYCEPSTNVVYLVKTEDGTEYDQYTLINDVLTFIGNTSVDLEGYATTDYVDEQVAKSVASLTQLLQSIKFIDGGTSSIIKQEEIKV